MFKDLIEQDINRIWREYKNEEFCEFSPLSVTKDFDSQLFFVGLNPSLLDSEKQKLKNEEKNTKCKFYTLSKNKENECKYYYKFYEVAENVGLEWGYLDLFYYREKEQKKIVQLLKTPKGTDFLYKQAMATKKLLDRLIDSNKPQIFVVTNTITRDLLGKYRKTKEPKDEKDWWLNFDFVWNNDWGTYEYKHRPFFFSGMLAGQGALDKGSLERLVWQINMVGKKIL